MSNRISLFNTVFKEMVSFLNNTYEHSEELKDYSFKINLAMTMSDDLIYSVFQSYVLKYKDRILACDESFFLNELSSSFGEHKEFLVFSHLWTHPKTTDTVKAKIFRFFIKLLSFF
jgi:hypothetical protein